MSQIYMIFQTTVSENKLKDRKLRERERQNVWHRHRWGKTGEKTGDIGGGNGHWWMDGCWPFYDWNAIKKDFLTVSHSSSIHELHYNENQLMCMLN